VTSSTSDPSGFRSTATSPTTRWRAYLAMYATKATEVAGHVSSRLPRSVPTPPTWRRAERVGRGADQPVACGVRPVRLWAHMFGFGGHFSTRSCAYSTTLRILRHARREWRRRPWHRSTNEPAKEAINRHISQLRRHRLAHHGNAEVANAAAARGPGATPHRTRRNTTHIADLMATRKRVRNDNSRARR
jgi:Replication initiator protein, pSAM2